MSTSTRVVKNTLFLYLRLGMTFVISLWTTRIILNALGIDNFGIYSVVGGMVSILGFLNASLSTATQRFINFAEGQKDIIRQKSIFNNSLILHFFLGCGLIVCFIIVGIICFNGLLDIPTARLNAAKIVYGCMVLSTAFSVMNVPYEATINAHEDMGYYAYIGIVEVILKLAIAFIITYVQFDRLIIYAILMASVPLITLSLMRFYCLKKYTECKFEPKKFFSKSVLKELGGFAGWNFSNSASGAMTQYGLSIVINHYFGVALNAAQGIAMQVGGVLINISSNALKALNPIIVKSESANQREKMIYVSLLGCRVSYIIFTLFSIPLIVTMDTLLKWWLSEVPQWAVIFCQLQLIRISTEMLTLSLNTSILAQGNIKWYNICRSITNIIPLLIVCIAFHFNAAPYWMYIIWIIFWSIVGGIVTLFYAKHNIGLKYLLYIRQVFIPAIVCTAIPIIIITCGTAVFSHSVMRMLTLAIAELSFICFSFKFLLQPKEKNEFKRILHIHP